VIGCEPMNDAISRRRAAKLIGAAAAGALLPIGTSRLGAAEESSRMLMRAVRSTGEKLPVIGLGSAVTFDVRPGSPQLPALGEVLALFVRHGGKLIDSSPMYGNAESVIGDLAGKLHFRDSLFFATKVWTNDVQEGIAQMERSMERFQTRKIDLMQVHNLVGVDRQMSSLREWKAKGRIRYTGITYSEDRGHGEVERIMKLQKPDFVQINYSLVDRAAAQRILPLAQDLGMGVIVNRPFGGGGVLRQIAGKPLPAWTAEFDCHSWAAFMLKWIVAHPAVTCVIPATNNPRHLGDNMAAGVGRLPDARTRDRMASLFVGF
jgi:diketogulonate reductase-like aldo/keto reductase